MKASRLATTSIGICLLLSLLALSAITFVPAAANTSAGAPPPQAPVDAAIARLIKDSGSTAQVTKDPATGNANFIRVQPGTLGFQLPRMSKTSAQSQADRFLTTYGAAFGIQEPSAELRPVEVTQDALGGMRVTFHQVYQGVPVFAGILHVHFDGQGRMTAANGTFIPGLALSTAPRLSPVQAQQAAKNAIAAGLIVRQPDLQAGEPTLYIYRAGLFQGVPGPSQLVYEVEVGNGVDVRQFVYVDALKGAVVDQIDGILDSLNRRAFDTAASYPSTPFWVEGDAFPSSSTEANNMLEASADAYNLFASVSGGYDSYDGSGATMDNVFNRTTSCPNASWNSIYTSFCPGLTTDDVTVHEWSHAYTEYTHGLIYQYQSGALNEAYSDIWGEAADLLNGRGGDDHTTLRTADSCSASLPLPPAVVVTSPVGIAGDYPAGTASFGAPISPAGVSGSLVVGIDSQGTDSPGMNTASIYDGCSEFTNGADLAGNIAFVFRGTCNYVVKAYWAQAAGAAGIVIANHSTGGDTPMVMSGVDPSLTLMVASVGYTGGMRFFNTLQAEPVDASIKLHTPFAVDSSVRFLIGEDVAAPGLVGALRDMWNPTCFGDPGKVSDPQYYCAETDNGGVHANSGIPNHAWALLLDGGAYNGQTITPLGMDKTLAIYWRAQAVYQVPATNFAGHADALEQACTDLTGQTIYQASTTSAVSTPSSEVITAGDCQQVTKAIAAVQLRLPPSQCSFQPLLQPEAPLLCESKGTVNTIFATDWESGLGSWTSGRRASAPGNATTEKWTRVTGLPDSRPGWAVFAEDSPIKGDCAMDDESGVQYLQSPVINIPPGALIPRLALDHWMATERSYDGGNLKISVNDGPWTLVPASAIEFNSYNLALQVSGNTNPLAGEPAWSGTNEGTVTGSWGQSQVNLSGIAQPGDDVQFRLEMGIDGCSGQLGWFVDEFQVYACSSEMPVLACGNGALDTGETCDDGNTGDGDGCSAACQIEPGFNCTAPAGPVPGTNLIQDYSFEASMNGYSPFWDEQGSIDTPLCTASWCGSVETTHGTWAAWFGGWNQNNWSSIAQEVTIPGTATDLKFNKYTRECDNPNDKLDVFIDNVKIWESGPCNEDPAYSMITIPLPAKYRDNAAHTLKLYSAETDTNFTPTNIFVDEVVLLDHPDYPAKPSLCTRSATDYVWEGGIDAAWDKPGNWMPNGVPGVADNVTIPGGKINYPALFSDRSVFNLAILPGGRLTILDGFQLTVEDELSNQGRLVIQRTIDEPQDLHIRSLWGTRVAYYTVSVDPSSPMGLSTLYVDGAAECTTDDPGDTANRCYQFSPASQVSSTMRFYYLESELEPGWNWEDMQVWHWSAGAWSAAGGVGSVGGSVPDYYAEAGGIMGYSPFVLTNRVNGPTVVRLQNLAAHSYGWLLASLVGLVLPAAGLLLLKRKRK